MTHRGPSPEPPPAGWEAWLQQGLLDLLRQQSRPAEEPLLGRSTELQQLLGVWDEVLRGHGRAVLVTGPPGMGKSRLVEELERRTEGRVLRCQAHDGLRWSPLDPLLGLAHRELGLGRQDDLETKARALERELQELGLRRREIRSALAWFLGLPTDDAPLRSPTRWRSAATIAGLVVLARLARRQPVLLVVEDLHWADPSTQAFLTLLAPRLTRIRLMLVMTSREMFPTSEGGLALGLSPLGPTEVQAMVTQAGLSAEIGRHLAEHASGVPLDVHEAARNARETTDAGSWPARLSESVAARLERLGPLAVQVSRLLACLEPGFSGEMALSVAPLWMDRDSARACLERLIQAGFLLERRGWLFHCHERVREEIYQSLDGVTRVRQHQRIAERLRKTAWGKQRPELLALQYTRAGLSTQAIDFWQEAALRAAQRGAHLEAIGQLRQALAELSDPDTELSLRTALGVLLTATRGYADPEVQLNYARVQELCEEGVPFPALHRLYIYNLIRGRFLLAEKLAQRCLQVSLESEGQRLEADLTLGISAFYSGQLLEAIRLFGRVLRQYSAERHGGHGSIYGQDPRVVALGFLAVVYALQGRLKTARDSVAQAVAYARGLNHPFSEGIALHLQAVVGVLTDQPAETCRFARQSRSHARREGIRFLEADTSVLEGWSLCALGQPEAGMTLMRGGLTGLRALGAEIDWPFVLSLLAECYEGAEALELLAEALAQEDPRDYFYRPMLVCLQGEKTASVGLLEQAAEMARACSAAWIELRALVGWSRLQGQPHRNLADLVDQLPEARDSRLTAAALSLLGEDSQLLPVRQTSAKSADHP